eukprot:121956-Pleurochrysis_carterae.AAC.3
MLSTSIVRKGERTNVRMGKQCTHGDSKHSGTGGAPHKHTPICVHTRARAYTPAPEHTHARELHALEQLWLTLAPHSYACLHAPAHLRGIAQELHRNSRGTCGA